MTLDLTEPEPATRHWSQLAAGDVVQAGKTIWMRIESVASRDYGWIVIVGQDLTGSRRGSRVTRFLSKGGPFTVRAAEEVGEVPRLLWTRPERGTWISSGHGVAYEIKRDRPYRPSASTSWRLLRDGEHWDAVPNLQVAKRLCERDAARRGARHVVVGGADGGTS